jgi:hypothetical protein
MDDIISWFKGNSQSVLDVCGFIAKVAGGYSCPDERFAMSQLACDCLKNKFPDDFVIAESKGYDLLFNDTRISLKIQRHIFQEIGDRNHLLKPQKIAMANKRSFNSAIKNNLDFDFLFAIQRGPFLYGARRHRRFVRFGVIQNDEWLQRKYVINNDAQQHIIITNDEWQTKGLLSMECEVENIILPELIRDVEALVRLRRYKLLKSIIDK